ncbi:hypothetical protein T484DRAFT_1789470, partial [Baffinella frigidus]
PAPHAEALRAPSQKRKNKKQQNFANTGNQLQISSEQLFYEPPINKKQQNFANTGNQLQISNEQLFYKLQRHQDNAQDNAQVLA